MSGTGTQNDPIVLSDSDDDDNNNNQQPLGNGGDDGSDGDDGSSPSLQQEEEDSEEEESDEEEPESVFEEGDPDEQNAPGLSPPDEENSGEATPIADQSPFAAVVPGQQQQQQSAAAPAVIDAALSSLPPMGDVADALAAHFLSPKWQAEHAAGRVEVLSGTGAGGAAVASSSSSSSHVLFGAQLTGGSSSSSGGQKSTALLFQKEETRHRHRSGVHERPGLEQQQAVLEVEPRTGSNVLFSALAASTSSSSAGNVTGASTSNAGANVAGDITSGAAPAASPPPEDEENEGIKSAAASAGSSDSSVAHHVEEADAELASQQRGPEASLTGVKLDPSPQIAGTTSLFAAVEASKAPLGGAAAGAAASSSSAGSRAQIDVAVVTQNTPHFGPMLDMENESLDDKLLRERINNLSELRPNPNSQDRLPPPPAASTSSGGGAVAPAATTPASAGSTSSNANADEQQIQLLTKIMAKEPRLLPQNLLPNSSSSSGEDHDEVLAPAGSPGNTNVMQLIPNTGTAKKASPDINTMKGGPPAVVSADLARSPFSMISANDPRNQALKFEQIGGSSSSSAIIADAVMQDAENKEKSSAAGDIIPEEELLPAAKRAKIADDDENAASGSSNAAADDRLGGASSASSDFGGGGTSAANMIASPSPEEEISKSGGADGDTAMLQGGEQLQQLVQPPASSMSRDGLTLSEKLPPPLFSARSYQAFSTEKSILPGTITSAEGGGAGTSALSQPGAGASSSSSMNNLLFSAGAPANLNLPSDLLPNKTTSSDKNNSSHLFLALNASARVSTNSKNSLAAGGGAEGSQTPKGAASKEDKNKPLPRNSMQARIMELAHPVLDEEALTSLTKDELQEKVRKMHRERQLLVDKFRRIQAADRTRSKISIAPLTPVLEQTNDVDQKMNLTPNLNTSGIAAASSSQLVTELQARIAELEQIVAKNRADLSKKDQEFEKKLQEATGNLNAKIRQLEQENQTASNGYQQVKEERDALHQKLTNTEKHMQELKESNKKSREESHKLLTEAFEQQQTLRESFATAKAELQLEKNRSAVWKGDYDIANANLQRKISEQQMSEANVGEQLLRLDKIEAENKELLDQGQKLAFIICHLVRSSSTRLRSMFQNYHGTTTGTMNAGAAGGPASSSNLNLEQHRVDALLAREMSAAGGDNSGIMDFDGVPLAATPSDPATPRLLDPALMEGASPESLLGRSPGEDSEMDAANANMFSILRDNYNRNQNADGNMPEDSGSWSIPNELKKSIQEILRLDILPRQEEQQQTTTTTTIQQTTTSSTYYEQQQSSTRNGIPSSDKVQSIALLADYLKQIQGLKDNLEKTTTELSDKTHENERLGKSFGEARQHLTKLLGDHKHTKQQHESLKEKVELLRTELIKWKSNASQNQDLVDVYVKQIEVWRHELHRLQSQLAIGSDQWRPTPSQQMSKILNPNKHQQPVSAANAADSVALFLERYDSEIADNLKLVAELRAQLQTLTYESKVSIEKLKATKDELLEHNNELEEQKLIAETKATQMEEEVADLRDRAELAEKSFGEVEAQRQELERQLFLGGNAGGGGAVVASSSLSKHSNFGQTTAFEQEVAGLQQGGSQYLTSRQHDEVIAKAFKALRQKDAEIENLLTQVSKTQLEAAQFKADYQLIQTKNDKLTSEKKELESENLHLLRPKVETLDQKVVQKQAEILSLRNEMTSTQEKIRSLQMEVTRFQRQELERDEELQKHKKKANKEVIEKEEQITLLQAELQNTEDKWRKELSLQAKQMENKEDLMQLYRRTQEEQIQQDQKRKREISELQAQKIEIEKKVDAEKAVNERFRAHLESVEKELAKVKEQAATAASRGGKSPTTGKQIHLAGHNKKHTPLDDAEVEKELNQLKEEKKKLKTNLEEANTQRRLLQQDYETLQKKLKDSEKQCGDVEVMRQVFAEKAVKLEKDLQEKEKEHQQFLKLQQEKDAKIALLQQQHASSTAAANYAKGSTKGGAASKGAAASSSSSSTAAARSSTTKGGGAAAGKPGGGQHVLQQAAAAQQKVGARADDEDEPVPQGDSADIIIEKNRKITALEKQVKEAQDQLKVLKHRDQKANKVQNELAADKALLEEQRNALEKRLQQSLQELKKEAERRTNTSDLGGTSGAPASSSASSAAVLLPGDSSNAGQAAPLASSAHLSSALSTEEKEDALNEELLQKDVQVKSLQRQLQLKRVENDELRLRFRKKRDAAHTAARLDGLLAAENNTVEQDKDNTAGGSSSSFAGGVISPSSGNQAQQQANIALQNQNQIASATTELRQAIETEYRQELELYKSETQSKIEKFQKATQEGKKHSTELTKKLESELTRQQEEVKAQLAKSAELEEEVERRKEKYRKLQEELTQTQRDAEERVQQKLAAQHSAEVEQLKAELESMKGKLAVAARVSGQPRKSSSGSVHAVDVEGEKDLAVVEKAQTHFSESKEGDEDAVVAEVEEGEVAAPPDAAPDEVAMDVDAEVEQQLQEQPRNEEQVVDVAAQEGEVAAGAEAVAVPEMDGEQQEQILVGTVNEQELDDPEEVDADNMEVEVDVVESNQHLQVQTSTVAARAGGIEDSHDAESTARKTTQVFAPDEEALLGGDVEEEEQQGNDELAPRHASAQQPRQTDLAAAINLQDQQGLQELVAAQVEGAAGVEKQEAETSAAPPPPAATTQEYEVAATLEIPQVDLPYAEAENNVEVHLEDAAANVAAEVQEELQALDAAMQDIADEEKRLEQSGGDGDAAADEDAIVIEEVAAEEGQQDEISEEYQIEEVLPDNVDDGNNAPQEAPAPEAAEAPPPMEPAARVGGDHAVAAATGAVPGVLPVAVPGATTSTIVTATTSQAAQDPPPVPLSPRSQLLKTTTTTTTTMLTTKVVEIVQEETLISGDEAAPAPVDAPASLEDQQAPDTTADVLVLADEGAVQEDDQGAVQEEDRAPPEAVPGADEAGATVAADENEAEVQNQTRPPVVFDMETPAALKSESEIFVTPQGGGAEEPDEKDLEGKEEAVAGPGSASADVDASANVADVFEPELPGDHAAHTALEPNELQALVDTAAASSGSGSSLKRASAQPAAVAVDQSAPVEEETGEAAKKQKTEAAASDAA
ncbi:unnamed protein product [Amoebophrya sp. A120]|nr:unnamed protein product [Amoebophrya sp. A120]|eukprot:GSA120T00023628001.1